MIILKFVLVILLVFISSFIVTTIEDKLKKRKIHEFSFKESLDLTNIPIITFYCGNKKLNFIVDTGSTYSHISKEVANTLPKDLISEIDSGDAISTLGFTGDREIQNSILIDLKYKDSEYPTEIYISDGLSKVFEDLKVNEGITLHGVLGNNFLNTYDYIIDFKEYIMYSKKNKK